MLSLKKLNNRGFTVIELLIVIVVIGILATLVVTTYSGIQEKNRDTQRKTDINNLRAKIETYQAQSGNYPTLANLNSSGWRATNLKGLAANALQDPKWNPSIKACTTKGVAQLTTVTLPNCFSYEVTPIGCDNVTTDCTSYILTATLEAGGTFAQQNIN